MAGEHCSGRHWPGSYLADVAVCCWSPPGCWRSSHRRPHLCRQLRQHLPNTQTAHVGAFFRAHFKWKSGSLLTLIIFAKWQDTKSAASKIPTTYNWLHCSVLCLLWVYPLLGAKRTQTLPWRRSTEEGREARRLWKACNLMGNGTKGKTPVCSCGQQPPHTDSLLTYCGQVLMKKGDIIYNTVEKHFTFIFLFVCVYIYIESYVEFVLITSFSLPLSVIIYLWLKCWLWKTFFGYKFKPTDCSHWWFHLDMLGTYKYSFFSLHYM